jgi:hypothetical protein
MVFLTKGCAVLHDACEVNFVVSSITMDNMWYLLCLYYTKITIWHKLWFFPLQCTICDVYCAINYIKITIWH